MTEGMILGDSDDVKKSKTDNEVVARNKPHKKKRSLPQLLGVGGVFLKDERREK